MKKIVYICSPLRKNKEENTRRAKEYSKYAVLRGYIPITPHIYFTSFLDDEKEQERLLGIDCGLELLSLCDEVWVFGDYISSGMQREIDEAKRLNKKILNKKFLYEFWEV